MNSPTALVAHPFPLVVQALAALVASAGYAVICASDRTATAAALARGPDLALIATDLGGDAAARARNGATRTLVIADTAGDAGTPAIGLMAPVEQVTAMIAEAAGIGPRAVTAAALPLTARERDVARLVAAGQRNRAIATSLGIAEGTVKMHLHNVYAKLGLESRTQLAMATWGSA